MKSRWLLILALIGACSSDSSEQDSGESDTATTPSVCAPDGQPSGFSVGTAACADGRCQVPESLFWRGQANGDADACPLHQVNLSAFSIDQTETTMGAYAACVQTGSCTPYASECEHIYSDWEGDSTSLPVVCVDHTQAKTYCEWAGGRLPSEAEWEKAARGEQGAVFPWGERSPLCEDGNFRFVSWYCQAGIIPVGRYPETQSAFGLNDTLGNVWEWTADYYDAAWYREAERVDPQSPDRCAMTVGAERGDCTQRVMRGGGFNSTEDNTRASARSMAAPDRLDVNLGFRCAYD